MHSANTTPTRRLIQSVERPSQGLQPNLWGGRRPVLSMGAAVNTHERRASRAGVGPSSRLSSPCELMNRAQNPTYRPLEQNVPRRRAQNMQRDPVSQRDSNPCLVTVAFSPRFSTASARLDCKKFHGTQTRRKASAPARAPRATGPRCILLLTVSAVGTIVLAVRAPLRLSSAHPGGRRWTLGP